MRLAAAISNRGMMMGTEKSLSWGESYLVKAIHRDYWVKPWDFLLVPVLMIYVKVKR